jgi:hypothetical protein
LTPRTFCDPMGGGVEVIKRPGAQIALKTNGFSMILIDL